MNRNKYAVVTIKIGQTFEELGELTIPFMKRYADKIGVDMVVIDRLKKLASDYSAYWAKFQLYDLFDDYERILFVDLDTLIFPHCPDIFSLIPANSFAAVCEIDHGIDQTGEMLEIQDRYEDINWRKDYFNVGVMVTSRAHREAFNIKHGNTGGQKFPEQTQINYNIQRFKIPTLKLDYRFNHTYFWGAQPEERAKSFIFHYAGLHHDLRLAIVRDDVERCLSGRPFLGFKEAAQFLQEKLPGRDITKMFNNYKLLKDSDIRL